VLPLAEFFKIPPVSIVPLTSYVVSPILGISLLGPIFTQGKLQTYRQWLCSCLAVCSCFRFSHFEASFLEKSRFSGLNWAFRLSYTQRQ